MLIKIKEDARSAMGMQLQGWILEVEDNTTNRINGARVAERYIVSEGQLNKLRRIIGYNIIPYVFCDDAEVVKDGDLAMSVDEHNYLAAMTNISRAHGYHVIANDSLYLRGNTVEDAHRYIAGWSVAYRKYLHKHKD